MFEFLLKSSCTHDKITPDMKAGYCPDCGAFVENHWSIIRCECCGINQKALVKNSKVITDAKFCRNCGSSVFITEKLNNLDIANINYAVVQKTVQKIRKPSVIETWIEQNSYSPMKLLPSC